MFFSLLALLFIVISLVVLGIMDHLEKKRDYESGGLRRDNGKVNHDN